MIVTQGVRGPASYATGGFNVTLGEIDRISVESGRVVMVGIASSGVYTAQAVNASGNIATILVRTASGTEIANATDLSAHHFFVIAEGY